MDRNFLLRDHMFEIQIIKWDPLREKINYFQKSILWFTHSFSPQLKRLTINSRLFSIWEESPAPSRFPSGPWTINGFPCSSFKAQRESGKGRSTPPRWK